MYSDIGMADTGKIAARCLADFRETKAGLLHGSMTSQFEVDYEVRLVIFLAIHIDGQADIEESHFMRAAAQQLDWSPLYQRLLLNRIEQQPGYDLDLFKIGMRSVPFARILYRLAYCTALINGPLNHDERQLLASLRQRFFAGDPEEARRIDAQVEALFETSAGEFDKLRPLPAGPGGREAAEVSEEQGTKVEDCLAELDQLSGLSAVKHEIKQLVSFLTIQQQRRAHSLSQPNLTLHMVFTGNPGTGKTTVARIVAKILRALEILNRGHLVETDRSGLVGQYIGHTSVKTNEKVEQALDGILFIDEAYSLARETENDFGKEAIDALVKRMEDHRERLVVIVAGYVDEMRSFIEANPGLRSRFNTFVDFENYSREELVNIFKQMCAANDYHLDDKAEVTLAELFRVETEKAGRSFGNGRFARNLFERTLRLQALRLSEQGGTLEKDDLMTLSAPDLAFTQDEAHAAGKQR